MKRSTEMIYHPPTKFCVLPALGYWELDGKPVSAKEAQYGLAPGAKYKETEIAEELHLHLGWFENEAQHTESDTGY